MRRIVADLIHRIDRARHSPVGGPAIHPEPFIGEAVVEAGR